jgi:glycosyltransferase involved in cell wall biosynthesis
LLSELRRSFRGCLSTLKQRQLEHQVVCLRPQGKTRGNVLFSYRIEGFLLPSNDPLLATHLNYWRSVQMAQTFADMGYAVDVIDFRNERFQPEKQYDVFIDVRHNMERLAPYVGPRCLKIFHIDTAHILHHNEAEDARLLALKQRRGVTLPPARWERPNYGIEYADCATGPAEGEFAMSTFLYARKPIYPLPAPVGCTYPWPQDKDWESCRKRFLWLGSGGLVHKGLDLTLEAFVQMPDCHLTVCAPIRQEPSFERTYQVELHETPNIHLEGWVECGSERYRQIALSCLGFIYPSASEGFSSSTVEALHAGLIPIISRETGVPARQFGLVLANSSIGEIQQAVRKLISMPVQELQLRARQAWEYARSNHTREHFAAAYREVITRVMAERGLARQDQMQSQKRAPVSVCD